MTYIFGVGVIVIVVALFVGGAVVVLSRRSGTNDTLNKDSEGTVAQRERHPEGAERSHLIGNPPMDTITTQGWGMAHGGDGALPDDLPENVYPAHEDPQPPDRGP